MCSCAQNSGAVIPLSSNRPKIPRHTSAPCRRCLIFSIARSSVIELKRYLPHHRASRIERPWLTAYDVITLNVVVRDWPVEADPVLFFHLEVVGQHANIDALPVPSS